MYSEYRNKGIGKVSLNNAKEYCLFQEYNGLALETAINKPAHKLYERLGWRRNTTTLHYFWEAK